MISKILAWLRCQLGWHGNSVSKIIGTRKGGPHRKVRLQKALVCEDCGQVLETVEIK